MDDLQTDNQATEEEITSVGRKNSRRQRQQLRFAQEEEEEEEDEKDKPEKLPSTFKPPGRASRFLSICPPSLELPGASLLRLQQLHSQATNDQDSLIFGEISDELLDKIPFQIEVIPDRRDDFNLPESALTKSRQKKKETVEVSTIIPSTLSQERRIEIIEEILKKLSQTNVLDEIRRTNAIPFRLPKQNQLQKNAANRIQDLMGSEIVMLNDHLYMKNLCQRLDEKHQKELEANFVRLASTEKHRRLFESIHSSK